MTTTYSDLELRIERARRVEADLHGKREHGLSVWDVGDYRIIDDGQDRWVCLADDYDDAVLEIVGEILDGNHDSDNADDPHEGIEFDAYSMLCGDVNAIYSRTAQNDETSYQSLSEEVSDPDTLRKLVEELGIVEEFSAWNNSGLEAEQ